MTLIDVLGDSARNEAVEAILPPAPDSYLVDLPLDEVLPSSRNPRQRWDETALVELADSIRAHGVIEPILVREMVVVGNRMAYPLIAGERRLRAAKLAGLATIPARVMVVDDAEAMRIRLVENLQRVDLDPIEEAEGYRQLHEVAGLKQGQIAAAVHRSQPAVANRMRLLDLPADVQERIRSGELTAAHGVALASHKAYPGIASKLAEWAVRDRWTSKQLEGDIAQNYELERQGLTVRIREWETGSEAIAACSKCPHYRAPGLCLDPTCYKGKVAAKEAIKEAERAAHVEAARIPGAELPETRTFGYGGYKDLTLNRPPAGCMETEDCPSRIQALNYDKHQVTICTNVKCHVRLKVAATRARKKAVKADVAATLKALPQTLALVDEKDARALAVIVARALHHGIKREARDAAFPGQTRIWDNNSGQRLDALASLSPVELVRCALEAILRTEQMGRLDDYNNEGTAASEWYLPKEAKE